jgi:hypothetical protein
MPHPIARRARRVLTLVALLALAGDPLLAQTATEAVAICLDKAADAFVSCVDDLPWYAESLCYSKYAADGILCVPANIFKFLVS